MFNLSDDELDRGYRAIKHHGYSTLMPWPLEWDVIETHWDTLREKLSAIDLDTYKPYPPMRIYAPKNRCTIRAVTLLHPLDLIIYTSLVLIVKNDIEAARLSKSRKRIFSYRSDPRVSDQLYQVHGAFRSYREQLVSKANQLRTNCIAIADIADFYPRVYQHRLENILQTVATSTRSESVSRVLVGKMMSYLAGGNSYGIPVGPFASRLLGEAVLIDVDAALLSEGINFVRWVDDYNFFCKSEDEAQYALFFLSRWLFDHHGLTLQAMKTKIVKRKYYQEHILMTQEERLLDRSIALMSVLQEFTGYEDEEDEIDESQIEEIEAINLEDMLKEALEDKDVVDYGTASFILGRVGSMRVLSDDKKFQLTDIVLRNIEHLYPVADSVGRFFLSFGDISNRNRKRISKALLRPMRSGRRIKPPDFYMMWVLSIFSMSPEWNRSDDLLTIYRNSNSEVVKRYAAGALSKTGNRNHALLVCDDFERASPLWRLGILLCSRCLGADERRHWKRRSVISGHLEKRI